MAIIKSLAIGKARKSAGNVTFRTDKAGRTIVSEKVGPRPVTRGSTPAQSKRTAYFAMINRYARMWGDSISVSFTPTKYGSSRNAFFKKNYNALVKALEKLASDPVQAQAVTDDQINDAVTEYATANPTAIRRIDKNGLPIVYLDGAWDSIEDPEGPVGPSVPMEIESVWINGVKDIYSFSINYSGSGMGNLAADYKNKQFEFKGVGLKGAKVAVFTNGQGTTQETQYVSNLLSTSTSVSFSLGAVTQLWGFHITLASQSIRIMSASDPEA